MPTQEATSMPTECTPESFDFGTVEGRKIVAAFDGGRVTSDAGVLLLGATDKAIGLIERLATCFRDHRRADLVEHRLPTLIGQRVFAIALGYEDLVDHDELRHDPVLAALSGKLEAKRSDCAPLAGKSTLNRLEHAPIGAATRYHKIGHDGQAVERLWICSSRPMPRHRGRSSSTSTRPTIRCTAIRKAASFTATTTVTATCLCTSSVAGICLPPCCGDRTSMPRPAASRRSSGLSGRFGRPGRGCGLCCVP